MFILITTLQIYRLSFIIVFDNFSNINGGFIPANLSPYRPQTFRILQAIVCRGTLPNSSLAVRHSLSKG